MNAESCDLTAQQSALPSLPLLIETIPCILHTLCTENVNEAVRQLIKYMQVSSTDYKFNFAYDIAKHW